MQWLWFSYRKLPLYCSNIQAYGVYISQLIWYIRACSSCGDCIDRGRLLTESVLSKITNLKNWRLTFEKFMVDTKNYNNIFILHLTVFMWHNSLLTCVAYTFRFHGGSVVKTGEVYSSRALIHTLGFYQVFVLSWVSNIFPVLLCWIDRWY